MLCQGLDRLRGLGRAAGDVADWATFDLAVGLGLGAASVGVSAGGWVGSSSGHDDQVEGLVEVAVPGPVQPNADGLATGGGDGGGSAQHGEGGVGPAAAGMGPGTPHSGGHDRADAGSGEQVGPPGPDQGGDGPGVLGGLGVEELDAAGQGAQAGRSGGGLGVPVAPLTQPPTGADQTRSGEAAQPSAEASAAATTRAWSWR
jgi:hypothetical protein